MDHKTTWKDRARYRMDSIFSRGAGAMIAALGAVSLTIVTLAGVILSVAQIRPQGITEPMTFWEAAWESLMRTLDAGTMGADAGWGYRLVMFLIPTVGGVFIISTLIGILSSAIEGKLEDLRKGRSRVLESGHTAILGWSQQIFTIIPELVEANKNQPRSCIVILGNKDKVEMEDEIREKAGKTGKTKIVCRHGDPMEMTDLNLASLNSAKSIMVLSPESDDPDAEVLKTVLAISNHPERRQQPYHIVAELREPKNADIARVIGNGEVEWVQVGDVVARVIAQTCRQSGLSVVYNELLDFGGDEIYFFQSPQLVGKTYGETLNRFEKNAVMGLFPAGMQPSLNPAMDTILKEGDQLVVIAEDDDKIFLNGIQPAPVRPNQMRAGQPNQPAAECTLILGWNWRGPAIIRELDNYVAPGSIVLVVASEEEAEEKINACCPDLKNEKVTFQQGDTTDRRTLDRLGLPDFTHIILLCYSDSLTIQQADSRTLITLLHLRDMAEKGGCSFSIVSEMLDVRNRDLADVTRADDFIVSDRMISLLMAQVSENKALNAVFTDLFDPEGSEIYLKPASNYVQAGTAVNFYTLVEAARQRGETAIGYRLQAQAKQPDAAYGVVLNPPKSAEITFSSQDKIIVLAEA